MAPLEPPSNHRPAATHVIEITLLTTRGNPHDGMSWHPQNEGHRDIGFTRTLQNKPLTDPNHCFLRRRELTSIVMRTPAQIATRTRTKISSAATLSPPRECPHHERRRANGRASADFLADGTFRRREDHAPARWQQQGGNCAHPAIEPHRAMDRASEESDEWRGFRQGSGES
jgi:hypothetical protein